MDLKKLTDLMLRADSDSEAIVLDVNGKWWVSTEWLVGAFDSKWFISQDKEDAIKQMCDYFDNSNDKTIKVIISQSGWPDLDKVEKYLLGPFDSFEDKKLNNEGAFLTEDWIKGLLESINKEDNEDVAKGMRKALGIIKDYIYD